MDIEITEEEMKELEAYNPATCGKAGTGCIWKRKNGTFFAEVQKKHLGTSKTRRAAQEALDEAIQRYERERQAKNEKQRQQNPAHEQGMAILIVLHVQMQGGLAFFVVCEGTCSQTTRSQTTRI